MRPLLALVPVLLVAACDGGSSDKEPFEPPEPDDTGVDVEETGDTADDDTEPPRDTGITVRIGLEGYATITLDQTLTGWEATTFRWVDKDGNVGKPKCVYYQPILDWVTDPATTTPDPLATRHVDCVDCTFSFAVSYGDQENGRDLPWDPSPTPPGDDLQLSCDNVETLGGIVVEPRDNTPPTGYGYRPSPSDATRGNLILWNQNDATWVPYDEFVQDATFQGGVFQWSAELDEVGWQDALQRYGSY